MSRTLIVLILSIMLSSNFAAAVEPTAVYGDGWIEMRGEYPVVHIKGNEEQMGEQLGYLAGDRIKANIDNLKSMGEKNIGKFIKYVPDFLFNGLRRAIGFVFYQHFSKDMKHHIRGIMKGAKKRPDHLKLHKFDIAFVNSLVDLTGILNALGEKIRGKPSLVEVAKFMGLPLLSSNCDSFAAWGPRTVDGKTFQTRNTDIATGVGIEKFPLVIVTKKDGKIPTITQNLAGITGILAGMNAYGVGLGQIWSYSSEIKMQTPWHMQIRDVFMDARNAREAVMLFAQMDKLAYGSNFVFADAGDGRDGYSSEGFAVEASAKHFVIFEGGDKRELNAVWNGQVYGLPLPYAVFRGDAALDPGVRAKQSASNGPKGNPFESEAYQNRYLGQYTRLVNYEKSGTKIGAKEAIAISRGTGMKDSNLMDAVYANTDRDMWVVYSKINDDGSTTQAYDREYTNVPFYKYLDTLSYDSNSEKLELTSYMPEKKRDLTVSISRDGKELGRNIAVIADQKKAELKLGEKLFAGDVLELRDAATGELADRLVIQN